MIRIAILNRDSFYSKLLAAKLGTLFPGKIKRVTLFNTSEDVIQHLDRIIKYDLVIIGDGICENYERLTKILKTTKCIANSKRFYRNKVMFDAGAHWIISKDVLFDAYAGLGKNYMQEWERPISDWFFR